MNSVSKHIGYLGLLVAFTLSNLGASHAGDLTGYDADGDGLIDYLDDNGNLWPNQQAWEASNAFVTAIEVAEPELPSTVEPAADSDGDGLTDDEENTLGTNPFAADTDGGGLSDYEETHDEDWRATDPLNPNDDMPSSPSTATDESSVENQPPPANEENATQENATQEELVEGLVSASNLCYGIAGGCTIIAVVAAETGVGWPVAALFGVLAGGFGILGAAFGEAANQAANSDPDPLP